MVFTESRERCVVKPKPSGYQHQKHAWKQGNTAKYRTPLCFYQHRVLRDAVQIPIGRGPRNGGREGDGGC